MLTLKCAQGDERRGNLQGSWKAAVGSGIHRDQRKRRGGAFTGLRGAFPAAEPPSSISTGDSTVSGSPLSGVTPGSRQPPPSSLLFKMCLRTSVVKYREIQERVRKQKRRMERTLRNNLAAEKQRRELRLERDRARKASPQRC